MKFVFNKMEILEGEILGLRFCFHGTMEVWVRAYEKKQKGEEPKMYKAKKALIVEEDMCYVCKEEKPPCESDEESDIDGSNVNNADDGTMLNV